MSAELICCILKGPRRFTQEQLTAARDAAASVVAFAKELRTRYDAGEDIALPLEDVRLAGVDEDDFKGVENFIEAFEKVIPEIATKEFVELWIGGADDMNQRVDPDDLSQKIVVAGEPTWGDEPSGEGYAAVKRAFQLGIAQALGIR